MIGLGADDAAQQHTSGAVTDVTRLDFALGDQALLTVPVSFGNAGEFGLGREGEKAKSHQFHCITHKLG